MLDCIPPYKYATNVCINVVPFPPAHTHTHARTTGKVSLSVARDRTSDSRFASNPNPINYGLEAGDIVFAFFGSVLLVVVGALVVLGFFIHPFFLS